MLNPWILQIVGNTISKLVSNSMTKGPFLTEKHILYGYALSHVGLPYVWGGDDFNGYDCSGLVVELLQSVGVFRHGYDTNAAGLYRLYSNAPLDKPCFGALVFFGKDTPTHVGFCLEDRLMLEAGGGNSQTKTREDAARINAMVRIRPIDTRSDIIGYVMPPYSWRD